MINEELVEKKSYIRKNLKLVREQLAIKYDNKCGYCSMPIDDKRLGVLDNYLPISLFPGRENLKNNLVYCCHFCNNIKGGRNPLDEKGNKIIINPNEDKFNDHIVQDKSGLLSGKTPLGKSTIAFFELNRKGLVQQRIGQTLQELAEDYSSAESIINNDFTPFDRYTKSISIIQDLSKLKTGSNESHKHLYKLLYANIITAMESYLSETLMTRVLYNNEAYRKYITSYEDFKKNKFELSTILDQYDKLQVTVTESLLEIMYHNISKLSRIYKNTLNINFPDDLSDLYKAVKIRHDIVHRNGFDENKIEHNITEETLSKLVESMNNFVTHIETMLNTTKEE